ncbi:hypothetical protein C5167_025536 [Papaver somniferum]|uniref:Serine/threonine-protein kinase RIO1 n=1 Tax=Papaver somniferum TaxID=3469 RepID=A0A4Y7JVJ7_PAPSO|nr:hypothetical protein C5167_025536 [Papaver somniferum]
MKHFSTLSNRNQRFITHLRPSPLEEWEGRENMSMPNSVTTAIRQSLRATAIGKTKTTDKRDRASVEQAIDPRTRMVLFKMLNRGIFDDINGCISTGKEANVYHATKEDGQEFAVKVYKTSVLGFKDRDRYIQGDYRFRHGYCKHNPRKMVKTWAEKEMRNLMRFGSKKFLTGKQGWAAPRLKDANLSEDKMRECYVQGNLHMIDVSQSVDLDHPLALDFLREDCIHVSDFFKKNGVEVMTIQEVFDFVVDSSITDESVECYLEEAQRKIVARGDLKPVEDKKLYIPRTLDQLKDTEEDVDRNASCQDCEGLTNIVAELEHSLFPAQKQLLKDLKEWDPYDTSNGQTDISTNSGTISGTDEEDDSSDTRKKDDTEETLVPADKKAARKENKKKVKEEKREARKTKTPKAVRKKKKKLSKNIKAR